MKYYFQILLCMAFLQTYSQDVEAICNCLKAYDYIDNLSDLSLKKALCELDIVKGDRNEEEIEEQLIEKCTFFNEKVEELRKIALTERAELDDIVEDSSEQTMKIVGSYTISRDHSPEGSPRLYVFADHIYAIPYFGGMIVGTWEIVKDQYIHFKPLRPKFPFVMYGRHNKEIGDSTKMMFRGRDFNHYTRICMSKGTQENLTCTPVFNEGANCFSYPESYKTTVEGIYSEIGFTGVNLYGDQYKKGKGRLYNVKNPEGYNELIIKEYIEMSNTQSFRGTIIEDGLLFEEELSPRPLSDSDKEGFLMIKEILLSSFEPEEEVYYNAGYKSFSKENMETSDYVYNETDNVYNYVHKDYNQYEKKDYDTPNVVYPYKRLKTVEAKLTSYTVTEGSMLYTVCD